MTESSLPAPDYRGKVRDIYDLGDKLLLVASDRISAFDVVFEEPVPEKGRILTGISAFWFSSDSPIGDIVPNHLLETEVARFPAPFNEAVQSLDGRSMLVKKARRVDFECVVRGYISGSAWREYARCGTVNGMPLPQGLRESERLPEPIFTPATKAESGHDENVSFDRMAEDIGEDLAKRLRDISLSLYEAAAEYVAKAGLLLADTKFEFGIDEKGEILLIDEALTPDSSRYWFQDRYEIGRPQFALDKQYLRDYLETLDWNKQPPPPRLPSSVIENTAERYRTAYRLVTGREFQ
ncbi:MAG: phosphoribosylaminoimidazolesuccinocarboxamide synthase [Candidatus Hydrogenedentota bacterium]|nr:MAG: phosphoribosylaminoimidazolesuccinocarboxamide synthase [Candidatus Hydrogenedentota bacterium]